MIQLINKSSGMQELMSVSHCWHMQCLLILLTGTLHGISQGKSISLLQYHVFKLSLIKFYELQDIGIWPI